MSKFYVTTSIPYANGKPHMGHTLDPLYADVLSRYHCAKGDDVFFLAGLDENGQKVYQKACEEDVDVKKWAEVIRKEYKGLNKKMGNEYNGFIRTSDEKIHHPVAQDIWKRAEKSGDIYKKKYKGLYCVGCESFKIKTDLVNGKCPEHDRKPEEIEEENYFFKLSKYSNFLLKHFKDNKDFVYPKSKYNESYQMIKDGLDDVSISRPKKRLPWGVTVPGDDEHVMYVWFDALTNYLSGIGFLDDKKKFEKLWPADLQIVGKDNNRWHTILWPAMLKSAGLELPKKVFVHSFILGKGGVKMSKTIGNVVDPMEIMDKYGKDSFRYFLLAKLSVDSDGVFEEDYFKEVYNTELASGLGNLVSRVLTMVDKYFEGKIPDIKKSSEIHPLRVDKGYNWKDAYADFDKSFESLELRKGLEAVNRFIKTADRYIDDNEPWVLAKKGEDEKLAWIIYGLVDSIHHLAWITYPYMPDTSRKIAKAIGVEGLLKESPNFKDSYNAVKSGTKISKISLFPRLDK